MARKILLADDSVTAQNMGRKILADAGYDVLTVNNGSAALKRIAESSPDLIILDVYMPGYSGLEVCQRLKDAEETAHIPVLLSVGKLEPFKPQEARRVRADAHIVKPFEASQLLTAIARLEDQMVPQQHKGSHRFATSGATTSFEDPFNRPEDGRILGRGAKLSKKNKDASQAERGDPSTSGIDNQLSPQAATFRDFRKKAKSQAASSSPTDYSSDSAAESVSHEPGPLAKLPGDITAEELSALSEVAAKLHEAAPGTQSASSSVETPAATTTDATDAQLEHEVAHLPAVEGTISSAPVSMAAEESVAAPTQEPHKIESAESIEPPAPALASEEVSAVTTNEIEIPVAQFEPTSSEAVAASEQFSQVEFSPAQSSQVQSSPVESHGVESQPAESHQDSPYSEAHLPDAVSTASFAQEPAPIDQQDEPMFASARSMQAYADEIAQGGEACVSNSNSPVPEQSVEIAHPGEKMDDEQMNEKKEDFASAPSSVTQAAFAETPSAESVSAESSSAESRPAEVAAPESISTETVPVAATTPAIEEAIEPPAPMPSDAELAEALRLLTPATVLAEPAAPSAETVPATPQWSDEETMEIAAGKRWVAEALALTPEEAGMSLEAEMFRAFAASAEKIESLPVENPLTAIQIAVENRLAAEAAAGNQFAPTGQAAPKAMAAVAPAGVTSATSSETDIASIVEKVMADLRPKIVEEIARKLAAKQDQ